MYIFTLIDKYAWINNKLIKKEKMKQNSINNNNKKHM